MWNEITNDNELLDFMKQVCYLHDCCIKEIKYVSGAYVNNDLFMHPINDRRVLRIIIQRQYKEKTVLELEFQGLKFLNIYPIEEKYSCEILDSTMFFKDGYIYWCDHKLESQDNLNISEGTLICSSRFRWRIIKNNIGSDEYYRCIE